MQLEVEKREKLIIRKKGRCTKEAGSKMLAFLPDVDLDIENYMPDRVENKRGQAITAAKCCYGKSGSEAGQSTGGAWQELRIDHGKS